jgi:hypothetical protein
MSRFYSYGVSFFECHYAVGRYVECRVFTVMLCVIMLSVIFLNVTMLRVVMLIVVMLIVVAPHTPEFLKFKRKSSFIMTSRNHFMRFIAVNWVLWKNYFNLMLIRAML